MVREILGLASATTYDFRSTAAPDDPLTYLFEEWVPYYRTKWAIARTLKPRRILEIGVRYGYSALAFLDACPEAEYLGIDADEASFGGTPGAMEWAKAKTSRYRASFLKTNSQTLSEFPGGRWDLIHVDGQQDGKGTWHDLLLALGQSDYILLDGFHWTRTNFLHASEFLHQFHDLIEYSIDLGGYAGDLLIKPKASAAQGVPRRVLDSGEIRETYSQSYYLLDCGGFDSFKRTQGQRLEEQRLRAVTQLAQAAPARTRRALDLGCGRGEAAIALAQAGFDVTAIDYSADAITLARDAVRRAGLEKKIQLVRGDVNTAELFGPFDAAIAADLIEHLNPEELDRLYARVAGLLVAGGLFVVHTFPNAWYYRFEYARRRRVAESVGAYLPFEPRTRYEMLMHINEQSPARMQRQLRRYFGHVRVWFANQAGPAWEDLEFPFSRARMRAAEDLYGVASSSPVDTGLLLDQVRTRPLEAPPEGSLIITSQRDVVSAATAAFFEIPVRVANHGKQTLRSEAPCPVHLAYHWLDRQGGVVLYEGHRTPLFPPLTAGATLDYRLRVEAPEAPGLYTLRVTMLQEMVRWYDSEPSLCWYDIPVEVTS